MFSKLFIKIALSTFQEISYLLQTRLPYPWDFCRFKGDPTTRLLLNSGSYFAVYAAFILWFVKYTLTSVSGITGQKLKPKDNFFVIIVSAAAAAQVFWPLLMLSTYFFTCSYYPWISALSVLSLYISGASLTLFSLGLKKSMEYLKNMDFNWSLDSFNNREISSAESTSYIYSARQSSPEVSTREESLLPSPKPHSSEKRNRHSQIINSLAEFKENILESAVDHNIVMLKPEQSYPDFPSEEEITSFESREYADQILKGQARVGGKSKVFNERKGRYEITGVPRSTVRSLSIGNLQEKMGYCGRCWRGNYLPFKQGFTYLRQPYTTRKGTVYGPTHRFLTLTDFLKKYGL